MLCKSEEMRRGVGGRASKRCLMGREAFGGSSEELNRGMEELGGQLGGRDIDGKMQTGDVLSARLCDHERNGGLDRI